MSLITLALIINILVAGFWGVTLSIGRVQFADKAFGPDTPARRILACLYLSIATTSLVALFYNQWTVAIISILFPIQIIYKTLSIVVVRNLCNPVVISNALIALILISALLF